MGALAHGTGPPQWMESLRLAWGTAGSRTNTAPIGEGLWGAGVFWNVRSWPLWLCGNERETRVHRSRGQFCQREEKQTACVKTSRCLGPPPLHLYPPAHPRPPQGLFTQPVGKHFPQDLGLELPLLHCFPFLPLGLYQVARLHCCPGTGHSDRGGGWGADEGGSPAHL